MIANIWTDPQSEGEVTLNSANPTDVPRVDPKLLSHPYDRRVMIETMRSMMDYLEAPVFKKNTVKMIGCPKSRSEEDIWVRHSPSSSSVCDISTDEINRTTLQRTFSVLGICARLFEWGRRTRKTLALIRTSRLGVLRA